jgi:hypothetical protein
VARPHQAFNPEYLAAMQFEGNVMQLVGRKVSYRENHLAGWLKLRPGGGGFQLNELVGSSMRMMRAFMLSARAIASNCTWPMESAPAISFDLQLRPTCSRNGVQAVVRYNVTPVAGLFPEPIQPLPGRFKYGLRIRCLNQITAKLMEVDLKTGAESQLNLFDSKTFRKASISRCGVWRRKRLPRCWTSLAKATTWRPR